MKRTLALLCSVLLALSASMTEAQPSNDNPEVPARLTIYVPTRHSKLERRTVRGMQYRHMPSAPSTYALVAAERSVPLLLRKARSSFPRGTKMSEPPSISFDENVIYVSLSKQLLQPGFWNSKQKALLAVYAIVNTVTEGYNLSTPLRVQLEVEGKRIRNLANVDLRKPLLPRRDIIAKRK